MSVRPVGVHDAGVADLVTALTAELAGSGYAEDEMFGYPLERLADGAVQLVAAFVDDVPVGLGGIELDRTDSTTAELKRFFVRPEHRGHGLADGILDTLLDLARNAGVTRVRLETGDRQQAAIAFYRRRGFVPVPRFGPYVDSGSSYCMERSL